MPEITTDHQPAPRFTTEEEVVRTHFLKTCEACGWKLNRVSEALGVSQKTVYNRLHRYESEGFVRWQGICRVIVSEAANATTTATANTETPVDQPD